MKRILLLAAVHVLIINQSNKDSKGKVQAGDSKKSLPKQEQRITHQNTAAQNNMGFITANFTGYENTNRKPALRQ